MAQEKFDFQTVRGAKKGDSSEGIEKVQLFLQKYGYFQTSDFKSGPIFDDDMTSAVQLYQHFHGLDVTGELDDPTLSEMSKPRCGFPDFPQLADFSLAARKWSKKKLTYKIINFSPDLPQSEQVEAIAAAFSLWDKACGLTFERVNGQADIDIKFEAGAHGDGADFDGPGSVLAHAFFPPPNGGRLAGDAHFDEAEKWHHKLPLPRATIDLLTVAAHEFGHSIGLGHSRTRGALMFPSYSGPQRYLANDDVSRARALYGK
ncbi:matrixin family metalloprotease [Litorimonas sp. WD9-15]|uniref:matrixin family metalloprotease n=1 Tax=Litorimonas sp. WD9-15 TaxID=3418716 RepID=UPI003D0874BF